MIYVFRLYNSYVFHAIQKSEGGKEFFKKKILVKYAAAIQSKTNRKIEKERIMC